MVLRANAQSAAHTRPVIVGGEKDEGGGGAGGWGRSGWNENDNGGGRWDRQPAKAAPQAAPAAAKKVGGRGRGSDLTMPAWMLKEKKRAEAEAAAASSTVSNHDAQPANPAALPKALPRRQEQSNTDNAWEKNEKWDGKWDRNNHWDRDDDKDDWAKWKKDDGRSDAYVREKRAARRDETNDRARYSDDFIGYKPRRGRDSSSDSSSGSSRRYSKDHCSHRRRRPRSDYSPPPPGMKIPKDTKGASPSPVTRNRLFGNAVAGAVNDKKQIPEHRYDKGYTPAIQTIDISSDSDWDDESLRSAHHAAVPDSPFSSATPRSSVGHSGYDPYTREVSMARQANEFWGLHLEAFERKDGDGELQWAWKIVSIDLNSPANIAGLCIHDIITAQSRSFLNDTTVLNITLTVFNEEPEDKITITSDEFLPKKCYLTGVDLTSSAVAKKYFESDKYRDAALKLMSDLEAKGYPDSSNDHCLTALMAICAGKSDRGTFFYTPFCFFNVIKVKDRFKFDS